MYKTSDKPATKDDLNVVEKKLDKSIKGLRNEMKQDLNEAVDAILTGMDNIATGLSQEIKENTNRINKLETSFKFMRQDMKDIKAEFSTTPSRAEFEELKKRVLIS